MSDNQNSGSECNSSKLNFKFNLQELVDCVVTEERCGYVKDVDTALKVVNKYENATTSRFVLQRYSRTTAKLFGNKPVTGKGHSVRWQNSHIPFNGVPFMTLGSKICSCQHGPDKNIHQKLAYAKKTKSMPFIKRRFLKRDTKKLDCPAQVILYDVVAFPDHKIKAPTEKRRTVRSAVVRKELKEGTATQERRIYICLPSVDDHKGHAVGKMAGLLQPLDQNLIKKIDDLVQQGVRTVGEMKQHLDLFVANEFKNGEKPDKTNRKYFPTRRTIKNHIYNATVRMRRGLLDQDVIDKLVADSTARGENVFFRPCTNLKGLKEDHGEERSTPNRDQEEDDDDTDDEIVVEPRNTANRLLFVHQTKWQSHILQRYGHEIAFLAATYLYNKTTKYGFPLFQVAVKTNVDYQVVAEFVVQDEMAPSITEALELIKKWNPSWSPRYMMTDLCEKKISAVGNCFPDCDVLLCSFHREQAWEQWVNKKENGLFTSRQQVLKKLRAVATSPDEETLQTNLESLYASTEWKTNAKYRKWFTHTWLDHRERWIYAYRSSRLLVYINTNNALEHQSKAFKQQYLSTLNDVSLGLMLKVLLNEYLPEKYQSYIEKNSSLTGQVRRYNPKLPAFLHNRPDQFVDHCTKRLKEASDIDPDMIQVTNQDLSHFLVQSSTSDTVYFVAFRGSTGLPFCGCDDWGKWHLPCKHMLAVIMNQTAKWEDFEEAYRQSPFLRLDETIVFNGVEEVSMQVEILEKL